MADTPDGKTPGIVPSKPGIMSVASTVLHPEVLDPLEFCNWYENTHIQEVQATGGISGTQRYESFFFHNKHRQQIGLSGETVPKNGSFNYDFLTIYNMPDLAFRESAAFRGLAGQSKPSDESNLMERIFKQTEFCTRFCEAIQTDIPTSVDEPAPFLLTAGTPTTLLGEAAGCRRIRRYKIREASVLSEFQRSYVGEINDLTIFECAARSDIEFVVKQLSASKDLEIGYWILRRDYDGGERTPAPWRPQESK